MPIEAIQLRQQTVLIIDDDPVLVKMLGGYLSAHDVKVLSASDGDQGLFHVVPVPRLHPFGRLALGRRGVLEEVEIAAADDGPGIIFHASGPIEEPDHRATLLEGGHRIRRRYGYDVDRRQLGFQREVRSRDYALADDPDDSVDGGREIVRIHGGRRCGGGG